MSKENANPIIHVKSSSQRTSLKKVDPRFFCARDKSVLMALADSNRNDDFIADLFGIDIEKKSKAGQVQQRLELELGPPKIFSTELSLMNELNNFDEDIDEDEIFDLLRNINDPEHPNLTLEQLNVVQRDLISVSHASNHNSNGDTTTSKGHSFVDVQFT